MTDFTAHSVPHDSPAGSVLASIRRVVSSLAALPAKFAAARGISQAFERGERPFAQDLETLDLPADFLDPKA
jgi:hypothetical protein